MAQVQDMVDLQHTMEGFYPSVIAETSKSCIERALTDWRLTRKGEPTVRDYAGLKVTVDLSVPMSYPKTVLIVARVEEEE